MQADKFACSDSLELVRLALLLSLSVEIGGGGDGGEGGGSDAIVAGVAGLGLGGVVGSEHDRLDGHGLRLGHSIVLHWSPLFAVVVVVVAMHMSLNFLG